jgi:hypothetical protein
LEGQKLLHPSPFSDVLEDSEKDLLGSLRGKREMDNLHLKGRVIGGAKGDLDWKDLPPPNPGQMVRDLFKILDHHQAGKGLTE